MCNGCGQLSKYTLKKAVYDAADAHIAFSENISEYFMKLFPVILTDNGSEFSNPKVIEYGPDGLLRIIL